MNDEGEKRRIEEDYNGDVLNSLQHISGTVNRMQRLLEGESEFSPGVVGAVTANSKALRAVETRVAVLERTLDRFRWTVLGAAAMGGILGGGAAATLIRVIVGG